MACAVCDHTMTNLGTGERKLYWCPRCGTLMEVRDDGFTKEQVPFVLQQAPHEAISVTTIDKQIRVKPVSNEHLYS